MPTIPFPKDLFIESLNQIQKQFEHDDKCHEAFSIILFNDYVSGYDYDLVLFQLLKIIKIYMNDNHKDSWIDYFIYELDFGKEYKEGCASYKNGDNIDLSSVETLYEFLLKEIENES
jgi:hypothetical protein